jgi:hypothetical protein
MTFFQHDTNNLLISNIWPTFTNEFCDEGSDGLETDTSKNFKRLSQNPPKKWDWINKKIYYTSNTQGYRCPEWQNIDWENSILLFGCSVAYGTGVDDSQTLSAYLQKKLKQPVINLASGGSSPMFQWANTIKLASHKIKPLMALYLWPETDRHFEFKKPNQVEHLGSWLDRESSFINQDHADGMFLLYLNSIKCTNWSSTHFTYSYSLQTRLNIPNVYGLHRNWEDLARDASHPGPKTHEKAADNIVKLLKL